MRPFLALLLLAPTVFAAPTLDDAKQLIAERKLPEARAALTALAAAHPADAEVCYQLGRVANRERALDEAIQWFEKAVALAPTSSLYHLELGGAYGNAAAKASLFSQAGLARKCRLALEKAVELDPKSVDARIGLIGFYRQAPGIVGGGTDKAHAQIAELLKLDPARGRTELAATYAAEKKFAEAFGVYEQILTATPDDYAALYAVGRLAASTGERLDRGLACLRRCLQLTPPANQPGPAPTHWRIGNILEKQGDKPAARAAYEAALQVDPKFTQAADALKKL